MSLKEKFLKDVQAEYLMIRMRMERLEAVLTHTSGVIVKKGKGKQYLYWQYYIEGKKIQKPIHDQTEEELRNKILTMQKQEQIYKELIQMEKILKRVLRIGQIDAEALIREQNLEELVLKQEKARHQEAREEAENKWHPENYKHQTDKGDLVASKSEEMIANALWAAGIPYQYEPVMKLGGKMIKPDFVIPRPDGKNIIWEHAGLLEEEKYASRFEEKLKILEKAGYMRSNNLIITEDKNGTFPVREIRRMIDLYNLKSDT